MGVAVTDEEIYLKYRDDLIRYAAALVGPSRAEDVLSTVMVRVLARGGLGTLKEARPYLLKAVLNEARSVLRRRPTLPLPELDGHIPPADIELFDAVMRLPARQRAAVYLVYWEGHPIADAAELMGSTAGTVKRYLHLARRKLKGVL